MPPKRKTKVIQVYRADYSADIYQARRITGMKRRGRGRLLYRIQADTYPLLDAAIKAICEHRNYEVVDA